MNNFAEKIAAGLWQCADLQSMGIAQDAWLWQFVAWICDAQRNDEMDMKRAAMTR